MDKALPASVDRPPSRSARAPRVAILADDLIWATRLEALVRAAGGRPAPSADLRRLERLLGDTDRVRGVVVDATSRAYDSVAAVERAAAAGLPVLVAAQHDDLALRRRALEAGAQRVIPYARLHAEGAALLKAWLGGFDRVEGAG